MNTDDRITTLLIYVKALVNDLAAENDPKSVHAMQCVLSLRKCYSDEKQAELDKADLERLSRLRHPA